MMFLIPSRHGISTSFLTLISTACAVFISVNSLSVSQQQQKQNIQQHTNNLSPISLSSNRDRREVDGLIRGEYTECNAFGRYTNCVCIGCTTSQHRAAQAERGHTIHCCNHLVTNAPAVNVLQIAVEHGTHQTYTDEFESTLKSVVVDGLVHFCQDEQHQDRCGGFEVNSLVAGNLHVMELVVRNSFGSSVLLIPFVVFATEKSATQSTERKRRFSLYSATNATASNDKVKRHAPFSDKNASPVNIADDMLALRARHIRRRRSVVTITVPGDVLMDAITAYDDIIEEQLGYSILVQAGDFDYNEITKSGWAGMSSVARIVVIILIVISGILAAVGGYTVYKKVAK